VTVLPGTAASFAERLRAAHGLVGYWIGSDNAAMTERIARIGFDYVCLDAQHGLLDAAACLRGLFAIDAAAPVSGTAGLVRVSVNRPEEIGRALDAGAAGVIVPLVNSAAEAVAAARACRYPPNGIRSYGPVRSGLRIGPDPDRADQAVACVVMIETLDGLNHAAEIAAVPGVDALYVGPSDLALALGAQRPADGWATPQFADALRRVRGAAAAAGRGCGMHTTSGQAAAEALAAGFTFASVSDDLAHLEQFARAQLAGARQAPTGNREQE
jgi:4-hydroxy-2-oxoheptanedioate aldolase